MKTSLEPKLGPLKASPYEGPRYPPNRRQDSFSLMISIYLGFNALMYAVFAIWCAVKPTTTAAYLGLSAVSAGGRSEYLAIYGGLQAGLAIFYSFALFAPEHRRTALWMSAFLYGGIVAFRSIAIVQEGFGNLGGARAFYVAEFTLFAAAALLVRRP